MGQERDEVGRVTWETWVLVKAAVCAATRVSPLEVDERIAEKLAFFIDDDDHAGFDFGIEEEPEPEDPSAQRWVRFVWVRRT